jgi:hypothetical protein
MIKKIFFLVLFTTTFASTNAFAQLIPSLNIVREKPPFPGYLYRPNDNLSHPAIVLLHGSEGGNGDFWYEPGKKPQMVGENALVPYIARYYAMLGYVTYAVCYFDCKQIPGFASYPPDELKEIDVQNITLKALAWLKNSQLVEGKKTILWGASRGAEQVLLISSYLKEWQTKDPSLVIPDGIISLSPLEKIAPAFPKSVALAQIAGEPVNFPTESAWLINGVPSKTFSVIEASKSPVPLLITSFTNDPVWTVSDMSVLKKQFDWVNLFTISITPQDLAADKLPRIPNVFPAASFIEFADSGHVFPAYGTEESKLLDGAVQKFMKQITTP